MIDMGFLSYFIDLEISQDDDGIKLTYYKYVSDILDTLWMTSCKAYLSPLEVNLEDDGVATLVDSTRYQQLFRIIFQVRVGAT